MSVLGAIEIQMLADLARLKQDMDQAKKVVGDTTASIRRTVDGLKTALGAIGIGLSAAAFANWIKGAIDAGDATKEFSQRTGIAAEDVAGLQLAFRQGGVQGDELAKSLGKLGKQMVEGNKAFRELGIQTRNADGSMRSIKSVLYDTADAFAATEDGAAKSALAQELFGKSGAALIPTLNEGSAGMREMAEMAEKLGLVIDTNTAEAADKFNDTMDLLGQVTDGMGRQVAAQLLPTLNSLAGAMLGAATEGDALSKVSDAIAAGLKVVFSVGAIGVEVFNTLGKLIGGVAGALVAVAQGELRQAQQVLEASGRDILQGWGSTAKMVEDAWTGAGGKTVETTAAMVGGLKKLTPATKEQEDAAKKAEEQQRKLSLAGAEYVVQALAQQQVIDREIALGRALTETEKELAKIDQAVADGKATMTAAQRALVEQILRDNEAKRASIDLQKELRKIEADALEARLKDSQAVADAVAKQLEENAAMGATKAELRQLERARLDAALATAEQNLQSALAKGVSAEELESYTLMVEELRKLKAAKEQGWAKEAGLEAAEAAKEAASAWGKTVEQLQQGLTDSLFRAFESGKGFFSALWDGIKNTLKTTTLRVVIDAVMRPVNAAIGGLLGVPGAAGAAGVDAGGGLGSLGGLGSMVGSIGGAIGSFGTAAGYGLSAAFSGNALTALSGGANMLMAGNVSQGLGMMAGTLGPYMLAAGALYSIYKKFDKSGTPHMGSVVGIDAAGSASTLWGDPSTITNNFQAETDKALRALGGASSGALNRLSSAFGGAGGFSAVLKFAADNTDPSIGDFILRQDGRTLRDWGAERGDYAKYTTDPTAAFQAYARDVATATRSVLDQIDMPAWAREQFSALASDATLEQFAATTDAVVALQRGLNALQSEVAPLGGVFADVAGLSSDALKQLTDFAGGIEAFGAKVKTYVGAYYSEAEQAAISAGMIKRTLGDVGIDASALTTRGDLRALVDSRDVGTEQGRRQLAALLDVAGAFAGLADYLEANGGTLGGLAGQAPDLAITRASIGTVTDRQTAAAERANEQLTAVSDAAARSATATESLLDVSKEGFRALWDRLGSVESAVSRAGNIADLSNTGTRVPSWFGAR